jgi:hypothetical protein
MRSRTQTAGDWPVFMAAAAFGVPFLVIGLTQVFLADDWQIILDAEAFRRNLSPAALLPVHGAWYRPLFLTYLAALSSGISASLPSIFFSSRRSEPLPPSTVLLSGQRRRAAPPGTRCLVSRWWVPEPLHAPSASTKFGKSANTHLFFSVR